MMVGTCGQGMMQRRNKLHAKLLSSPSDPMYVSTIKHSLKYGSSADAYSLYPFYDYAKYVCLVDNFDLLRED
jgi:hypothetical protein